MATVVFVQIDEEKDEENQEKTVVCENSDDNDEALEE